MTAAKDRHRDNPRVFTGKKAKQLRAAMKRLVAERERKVRPDKGKP